jgi:hypothetical protein
MLNTKHLGSTVNICTRQLRQGRYSVVLLIVVSSSKKLTYCIMTDKKAELMKEYIVWTVDLHLIFDYSLDVIQKLYF